MTKQTKQPKLHDSKCEIFKILENDGKFQIVMGNAVISKKIFKNKTDAEKYIAEKPWDIIINSVCYCMDASLKAQKYENKNQQETAKDK